MLSPTLFKWKERPCHAKDMHFVNILGHTIVHNEHCIVAKIFENFLVFIHHAV